MKTWAVALLSWLAFAAGASAATLKTEHVQAELVAQGPAVPGGAVYVALRQRIVPHWHTYWRNPGDSGQATTLKWTLPPGWRAGEIVWPRPETFRSGPLMNYVYSDQVLLPVPIDVPASARPGQTITLKAQADWLVCKDVCIPEGGALSLDLPVAAGAAKPDRRWGKAIEQTLAAAPKPAGLKAAFRVEGGVVRLAVVGGPVTGVNPAQVYFFPYDGSVLDHAAPEKAQRGPRGVTLSLQPGYAVAHNKVPAELSGVLAVGLRAYEVTAVAGPLPAGAAGLGPLVQAAALDRNDDGGGAGGSPAGLGLVAALGLAFAGGLILNLMPCVFPVLSMKAAALARHAEDPQRARREGVAFLAGVVATFLVLAALLIAARAGGEAVGWGFQLQSPAVVAVLTLIMLAAALNLSGVFEVGLSAQGAGSELARRGGLAGAFFTGVLAVVVAAPCTAPFMAPAIGWAVTQEAPVALAVFLVLGLGLAAPFTAASFIPGLFRRLPKPGPWMETLRRVLAFPMYGAAAWLAWVFALQQGVKGLPFLFAAALALAFAAWLWGLTQRGGAPLLPRLASAATLVGAVGLSFAGAAQTAPAEASMAEKAVASADGGLAAQPWSPEKVAELQAAGKPVLVDFTAAWCVTCQLNERTALAGRAVADAFARTGAVYLKADWTLRDPRIGKALAEQGRSGVPLYLVYAPGEPRPQILPQLLTEGLVVDAIDKAARRPNA